MIELKNATRSYGKKVAVDQLNLTIPAGQLFAFLGPNGAGKTTTIKMLVSLLRPDAGEVRICGVDVVKQPREANHKTGYVPDEPYLYDKLSGREFLQFTADMYGLTADGSAAAIAEQIDAFELGDFIDNLSESYSHGMKQRVVFASALLHKPDVLIVDEPMVGLDPRSMRLVKDLLRSYVAGGRTVFMSTHTLHVAEQIADRIGVFQLGKVVFLGTVADLQQRLADEQVEVEDESLEQLFLALTRDGQKD